MEIKNPQSIRDFLKMFGDREIIGADNTGNGGRIFRKLLLKIAQTDLLDLRSFVTTHPNLFNLNWGIYTASVFCSGQPETEWDGITMTLYFDDTDTLNCIVSAAD